MTRMHVTCFEMELTQFVIYVKGAVFEDPIGVVEAETPSFAPSNDNGFGVADCQ